MAEPVVSKSAERTREIRRAIASLQTDAYSDRATGDPLAHLSVEDRTVLQLATENLVQAIVSTSVDQKLAAQSEWKNLDLI